MTYTVSSGTLNLTQPLSRHLVKCRRHQSVVPPAGTGTLLTEVNCEDGGQTYVLAVICCRVWAQKLVCNNLGYITSSTY